LEIPTRSITTTVTTGLGNHIVGDRNKSALRLASISHLLLRNSELPLHGFGLIPHDGHLIRHRFITTLASGFHFIQLPPHNPKLQDGGYNQNSGEDRERASPSNQVAVNFFLGWLSLIVAVCCGSLAI
jgi:hypothetical protein